ncbi:hypothetical protein ABFS83_08G142800 [Erythranthe nasuta]
MASYNIARFIFVSAILIALFIPHECVDNSRKILAKADGEKQIIFDCTQSVCGIDECWCCIYNDYCFDYEKQCKRACTSAKHPKKVVS